MRGRTHPNSSIPNSFEPGNRVLYLDGLRGIAIALVLVFHVGLRIGPTGVRVVDLIVQQGFQGVALFLVLSGFCLSYPALQRRAAGSAVWFTPSSFFSRRLVRILPPYYVALAVFVALKLVNEWHHSFATKDAHLTIPNILSHLFLIHNLTPYATSINGPFWSLGLEWQWYWVFPIVLVLSIWRPTATAVGCALVALGWHLGTNDLWGLGALPARLFEFTAGVVAARLVVDGAIPRQRLLVAILFGALLLLELPYFEASNRLTAFLAAGWFTHLLCGALFTSLLLLGASSRKLNAVLSWRPLLTLGFVSYSVYLIHQPVVDQIIDHARHIHALAHHAVLLWPIGLASGILAGAAFFFCVERLCLRRETWAWLTPHLVWTLGWTDYVWIRLSLRREQYLANEYRATPS